MKKRIIWSMVLTLQVVSAFADMVKPTFLGITASKYLVKKGDIVELTVVVKPAPGLHIYSEKNTCAPDVGAIEAELTYSGDNFELVGKSVGIGDKIEQDPTAELDGIKCNIGVFPDGQPAVFKQKIRILGNVTNLKCAFYGQQCNDNGCVNIDVVIPLTISIKVEGEKVDATVVDDKKIDTQAVSDIDTGSSKSALSQSKHHSYRAKSKDDVGACAELKYTGNLGEKGSNKNNNLWVVFWLALTSGFLALLTPCVFPMIPMTVSFFIRNKDRKKALRDGFVFAFSIILIYVVLGTLVAAAFGPSAANWLSTHWAPNIFFFLIFVVFAASFFGAFEIVLPSSWVNAMDKRADRGGWTGPVFMAFTIALVSFSCTGPIVGAVLVESAKGGLITPIIAMFGFSLAFALPFGLLVIFPSYLQSLPKSGGWLNSVKVVLGFVELAFALKFLSTADQTYHWRLLDREVYLAIWIVIFSLMGLYLLGKLKFAHDSDLPYLSVTRLLLSIATLSFVAYMVPGMWGAPLKSLAGYLPPMATQDFDMNRIVMEGNGKSVVSCGEALYSEDLHIPHGIKGYFDYEQALACAKEQNKPLFIDFTGHGCVNCRKMEEKVWSDPAVLKILKNDYVVVSLYVDDKKLKLPESDQFIAHSSGKKITMLGEKNTEIQACYFNSNSQPMYVLMASDETLLQHPGSAQTFNYDPKSFATFLKNGLTEFQKIKK